MTTARVHPTFRPDARRRVDRQVAVLAASAAWCLLTFLGIVLLLL